MRALYLDFPQDNRVDTIDNEYMFGRAFLVSPVTEKGLVTQSVYLPAGATWYDFWTGAVTEGGRSIDRSTPIDILPLYVRAGSIIPWGPKVQFAEERRWDDLEVRLYPGADGSFTLYEDENNSYNYEKGMYSEITFHWDDKAGTLTVGDRKGSFTGMLLTRKFTFVAGKLRKTVIYKGTKMTVPIGH